MRGGATPPASAHRSARGAIFAAVLASELADTAGLEYRKENEMSKKPRKRKEGRNIDRSSSDVLSIQKQTMKKAFLDYLGAAIMFFVMALVVLMVGLLTEDASHSKLIVFGATPIILGFTMFFTFLFLRRFVIFKEINKITSSSEQTIKITCKKVAFLTQPISKHNAVIICIVLTDENGKKYYDVVNGISDSTKKATRAELLNTKVSLNCYANTNCVKTYQVDAVKE